MNRRDLLRAAATAAIAFPARLAYGFGDASRFTPAILRHRGAWNARPNALRRLCWELASRTSVEVHPEPRPFDPADRDLFHYPFAYLGSDGPFPPFSDAAVANLRRYLTYGGFLLADANDGSDGDGFDASFRREAARILSGHPLERVPAEHVLFKTYYLLDHHAGRLLIKPYLSAATLGRRVAVVYSQNDLAGAWARDEQGDWEHEVVPGGESQREIALRSGVNIALYALCLDYKEDAVHVPFILKRRR